MSASIKKCVSFEVLCFIVLLCCSVQAQALIVLQNASASMGTDYDTNVSMSNNAQSNWRYTLVPSYTVSAVDDLNRWYSRASLNIQRSSNKSLSIDRQDPSIGIGWARQLERGGFSLAGSYSKASTRVTEFDTSGLVTSDASTISKSISANWSRLLTDRINWSVGGGYNKSSFNGGGGFSGFSSKSLSSSLGYEWSEQFRSNVSMGFSTYTPEAPSQSTSHSQTFTVGSTYALNPRITTSASGGLTRLSAGVGKVGSASMTYLGDASQLSGSIARSVTPSSVGGFQNSDSMSISYGYTLSEKSRLGSSFSWRRNNSLNDNETRQVTGFYARDLSEYWQMRISMQMRQIKSANQSVNGETLGITFVYNTPEF